MLIVALLLEKKNSFLVQVIGIVQSFSKKVYSSYGIKKRWKHGKYLIVEVLKVSLTYTYFIIFVVDKPMMSSIINMLPEEQAAEPSPLGPNSRWKSFLSLLKK